MRKEGKERFSDKTCLRGGKPPAGGHSGKEGRFLFDRRIVASIVAGSLLAGLYCLIFSFSAQDAEESGSLSSLISEKCVEILNVLSGKHWSEAMVQNMAEYFEHPIRKLAHFGEYTVMGVLVYLLWRPWMQRGKKLYFLALLWVFFSAAADEFHQVFVPGRYGSFPDVLLDTGGGLFGVLACVGVEKAGSRFSHSRLSGGKEEKCF